MLDVYDDHDGSVLREVYPTFDDIPATVKEAHVLSAEDRRTLPDDVFALVLVNHGESLRKYACIDEGSTTLAIEYFVKNAHKLPVNAQQSTAENLVTACGWYGLEAPEPLQKLALGVGTAVAALTAPALVRGTHEGIKNNMAAVHAHEAAGAGIVTPRMMKSAEVSGTALAPNQGPANPAVVPSKTVIPKTAHMHPAVDVSNYDPQAQVAEKKASVFALPSQQKYPIDTHVQMKTASAYFEQYAKHMSPAVRREFAFNFMKQADALDIMVSNDGLRKYGSAGFAPETEIKAAFDARRLEVMHNTDALELLGAVEKVARTRIWKEAGDIQHFAPEEICALVEEFDKVAGLNHRYDKDIPDPYYSIYGFEKTAEDDEAAWSDQIGNDYVTSADLKRLAQIGAWGVKTTFGADFQEEFLKDPVGMYKSLPRTQRKMLIRMADGTQPGVERTY